MSPLTWTFKNALWKDSKQKINSVVHPQCLSPTALAFSSQQQLWVLLVHDLRESQGHHNRPARGTTSFLVDLSDLCEGGLFPHAKCLLFQSQFFFFFFRVVFSMNPWNRERTSISWPCCSHCCLSANWNFRTIQLTLHSATFYICSHGDETKRNSLSWLSQICIFSILEAVNFTADCVGSRLASVSVTAVTTAEWCYWI